jgi:hypothetical protein
MRSKDAMTKQKTPHTQTQQNTNPEQTDLEPDERAYESGTGTDEQLYSNMDGAETGENRSMRKFHGEGIRHKTEPETEAHEGSISTRTPKLPSQGVTSRSAEEESGRQQKVVNERPDAQAGVNHSK